MRRPLIISIMCAAVIFAGMAGAQADIIYDNFGPGDTYNTINGMEVLGIVSGFNLDQASSFVPTDTYTLDTIELAMSLVYGPNDSNVSLMDDASGHPGSVIDTFTFADEMVGDSGSILLGTSVLNPILNAGSQYWLVCVAEPETVALWKWSEPWDVGYTAERSYWGSWNIHVSTKGAFRITGTPVSVPEPSTLLLLGTGLAGAAILRRRFKN